MFQSCTYISMRHGWNYDYFKYDLVDTRFNHKFEIVDTSRSVLIEAIAKEYNRRCFNSVEAIARFYMQVLPPHYDYKTIRSVVEADMNRIVKRDVIKGLADQYGCILRHIKLYLWSKGVLK